MNRLVKEIVKKLGEEGIPVTAIELLVVLMISSRRCVI